MDTGYIPADKNGVPTIPLEGIPERLHVGYQYKYKRFKGLALLIPAEVPLSLQGALVLQQGHRVPERLFRVEGSVQVPPRHPELHCWSPAWFRSFLITGEEDLSRFHTPQAQAAEEFMLHISQVTREKLRRGVKRSQMATLHGGKTLEPTHRVAKARRRAHEMMEETGMDPLFHCFQHRAQTIRFFKETQERMELQLSAFDVILAIMMKESLSKADFFALTNRWTHAMDELPSEVEKLMSQKPGTVSPEGLLEEVF